MQTFIISEDTNKIFFDFDGVIVDSNKFKELAIEGVIKNNCSSLGKEIEEKTILINLQV